MATATLAMIGWWICRLARVCGLAVRSFASSTWSPRYTAHHDDDERERETDALNAAALQTWLSSHRVKFQRPIAGQNEVLCKRGKTNEADWKTQEGIYFPKAA